MEDTKSDTKELASKVSKVNAATDKIASKTWTYRDALVNKAAYMNRSGVDPKVLSDMDCRARQILVNVYDKDTDSILTKSLTKIMEKANAALDTIEDIGKPKEAIVVTALKGQNHTILLTLSNKEMAAWVREGENELLFANSFSKESHIRSRTYNLIVPRIPLTFNPKEDKHLQELEEVNGLRKFTISTAKWIKLAERRHTDQMHALTIISLYSAESANILI